ncbi:hypothetical protein [Veronia nyctiphanis]|nr:hypothetical protein [Veronia nyctiphanis]
MKVIDKYNNKITPLRILGTEDKRAVETKTASKKASEDRGRK